MQVMKKTGDDMSKKYKDNNEIGNFERELVNGSIDFLSNYKYKKNILLKYLGRSGVLKQENR